MNIVLTKAPNIVYPKGPYVALMDEGYAFPIEIRENATVLLFKDVEDHIDGNGVAILWMIEGGGDFYYDGKKTALKKGDVVVFDDTIEHGFEAPDYCLAVNFDMRLMPECSLAQIHGTIASFEKHYHASFLSSSPNF